VILNDVDDTRMLIVHSHRHPPEEFFHPLVVSNTHASHFTMIIIFPVNLKAQLMMTPMKVCV